MIRLSRQRGQGLVEYALILALVAIVVGGTAVVLGPTIGNVYSEIMGQFGNNDKEAVVQPENILQVTVRDAAGEGIPGITVAGTDENGHYTGHFIQTDENGEVAIKDLPEGRYKFRAIFFQKQFWSRVVTYPREWQTDIETGQQEIVITTVDAAGNPVKDAWINAYDTQHRFRAHGNNSDENGQVSIALVDGEYTFRAYYRSHEYWSDTVDTTQETMTTIDTGEAAFTVRVTGADGAPLSRGIRLINVWAENGRFSGVYTHQPPSDGVWEISLPRGRFKIQASYDGKDFWSDVVEVPQDDTAVISTGERDIFIRAVDAAGGGVSNVRVNIFLADNRNRFVTYGTTDSQGELIVRLSDGDFAATTNYAGHVFWSDDINTPHDEGAIIELGQKPFPVSLVDAQGQKLQVSGLRVHAYNASGQFSRIYAATDESGVATLDLPIGQFKFNVNYRGSVFWTEVIDVSVANQATIQTNQQTVTVRVITANGSGISNIHVHAIAETGGTIGGVVTNSDGVAKFDLPAGRVKYRAFVQYAQIDSSFVTLPQESEVTLQTGMADVFVTLRDQDGKLLQGAWVGVYDSQGRFLGVQGRTNAAKDLVLPLIAGAFDFRIVYQNKTTWFRSVAVPGKGAFEWVINKNG